MSLDHDFDVGSPVVQTDDKVLLRLKDGSHISATPASAGPAEVVEQFEVRRRTAVISGWTAATSTSDAPKTVVITMHNRIWGLASSGAAASGTAGEDSNLSKSRFRLFACDVDQANTADFRAYVWSGSGSATELEYLPAVRPARPR